MMMDIENEAIKEVRSIKVKIKYDMIPSYCKNCKLQGHKEVEYRVLHPELRKEILTEDGKKFQEQGIQQGTQQEHQQDIVQNEWRARSGYRRWHPTNKRFVKNKEIEYVLSDDV